MSSTTTEAAITALNSAYTANCILAVACTLYVYERCIIFDQEVELIWRRRVSVASVAYGTMHVSMVTTLWTGVALLVTTSCNAGLILGVTEISSKILFRWAIAAISALRVYAINGRSLVVPSVILLLFLTYTLYDFYNACSLYKLPAPPPVGCILLSSMRPDVQHGLKIAGLVCAAVAEALVLVATWRATYRARKATDSSSMRTSVSGMLLRDGTVYFGVILFLLVLNAILEIIDTDISITSLTYVLQTACMSRFYIDLRQAALPESVPTNHSQIHVSFSRFVDTLEGSLVFGADGYVGEDEFNDDSSFGPNDNWGVKSVDVEGIAMTNMTNPGFSSDLNASSASKQKTWKADAKAI